MASVTDGLKRKDMFAAPAGTLVVIGLDTSDGPEHPLYDDRIKLPLDEAMVKNIMVLGVLEPVIGKKDSDRVIVVDGRRRELHAREASRRSVEAGGLPIVVPFILTRGDEATMIGTMVSANEIRKQDEYQDRAKRCQRMVSVNGMSEGDCALYFGVHIQTIKQWLSYFDLTPEVQQAVSAGELKPTAATKLAKLPADKQKETLAKVKEEKKEGKKASGREVEAAVRGEPQKAFIRPSTKRIREVASKCSPDVRAALLWTIGEGAAPGGVA